MANPGTVRVTRRDRLTFGIIKTGRMPVLSVSSIATKRTECPMVTARSESPGRNRGCSGYFEIILRSAAVIIIFPLMSIVSPVIATVWLM